MELFIEILVCFLAGAGAGIGTGFAGMSAAAVIGPMLATFLGIPAYQAIGVGLISDVLASSVSAYTYHRHGNLDIKNSIEPNYQINYRRLYGWYYLRCCRCGRRYDAAVCTYIVPGL